MLRISWESSAQPRCTGADNPRILALTHVFDNPNWFYNFHTHDTDAEIIYVQGGHGMYTLDNVSYSATAGTLIVINPGVMHSLASDPQNALDAWTLTLTGFQLPGLEPGQVISPASYPLMHPHEQAAYFSQNFQLILQQYQQKTLYFAEAAHAAARTILYLTHQLSRASGQVEPRRGSAEALQRSAFIMEVIGYMDKHFREPITLERLSDVFHVSAGHISHTMTQECGISPINYLISRRLGEAQWLLLTTDDSIRDIAQQVGYENIYHFSKLFDKRIGMRPQSFREKFNSSFSV